MKSSLVCPALLAGIVAAASPSFAVAQEQVAPPRAAETPSRPAGTSMMFVRSGIGLFTLSYLPAGVVGTTSRLKGDRSLVVPVAGPWLDLTQRPGCAAEISCNGENTTRALLITDGIFQAIGALTIVGGLFTTSRETKKARTVKAGPTLDLSPTQLGAGGYGVVALGRF